MKNTVQKRCELLVENRNLIQEGFMLENSLLKAVAAAAFAEKEKTVDVDYLKECRSILRDKQGALSSFRGNNELIVSTKMALGSDPEKYIDEVIEVYKKFQKGKCFGSTFRVLAAMSICDAGKFSEADAIIEKTNNLLEGMRKKHPFIATDEDTSFAVLLAMTEKSVEEILTELEEAFGYIKKSFSFHDNAAYSLTQVLTIFDGSYEDKRDKVLEIYNAFKAAGLKYGKEYELASLGTLININLSTGELVSEVAEAAKFFDGKKGFGMLDMNKQTKLMLGAMVVSGAYSEKSTVTDASVTSGAISMIIAEQTAMLVAIMIASSSAAASSSSSN
ncbi:DUF4003 family protein [Butyrivibrio sp. INlla16]|uniref:DUF4003 family protein n=1 Tax=Butyrivibrio sp. INlla16 TaxID=1520807 RepID=UPI00087E8A3C|nr:DUF4003 family protein [Butyrivibrio sp. INlla16]SDB57486.1 Protein of unknown function [Butyrivibrio sp. INlla16]